MIDRHLGRKAAIGSSIIVALLAVSFAIGGLRILERSYEMSVIVDDASGLEAGDPVRVAGVNIGEVRSVERVPRDATVAIRFGVEDGVEISEGTFASVRLRTLLGKKYLHLEDPGTGPVLAAASVIPVEQTQPATDVDTLLNAAEPTVEQIDVDTINQLLASADRTLAGRGDQLRSVFADLGELAGTLADRETELASLIESTADLSTVVGDRDEELTTVLQGLDVVLATLAQRGDSLTSLLDGVDGLSQTLSPLLSENRAEFATLFGDLNTVTDILVRQYDRLDVALEQLPDLAERFYAVTAEGSWVNVYIVGVVATPFVMNPVDLGSSTIGEPGQTGGAPRLWVDPPQLLPSSSIGGIDIDTGDNRVIPAPEGF